MLLIGILTAKVTIMNSVSVRVRNGGHNTFAGQNEDKISKHKFNTAFSIYKMYDRAIHMSLLSIIMIAERTRGGLVTVVRSL
jgi:hypothetical protein